MRVDILAIGSRGDVQPYVALGAGLRSAGYRTRIVTLGGFEDLVRSRDLEHLSIGSSPQDIANTAAGREWIESRETPAGFFRGFVGVANSVIEKGISDYWSSCQDVEALIASPMGLLVGGHIADRLGIPLIQAQLAPPIQPTRYDFEGRRNFATASAGAARVFLDALFHFLVWRKLRPATNAARSRILGLPPLPLLRPVDQKLPLLGGYSPSVAPKLPDWGDWIHVTGYWFLDELPGWTPPGELVDFLQSGPQPVFIGFGSTPFPNPEAATSMVVRALERAGQRGVVLAGGSGLATGRLSDDVLSVSSVPHDWLFSRVCAAVHHGGAGVTGAALRAGLPSVVTPIFADQPFWGSRVFELGAGPPPIPARRLTEDNLAASIRATSDETMRRRCAELGRKIRAEDGIAKALSVIDRELQGKSQGHLSRAHAN